jgi:hypothetical protein
MKDTLRLPPFSLRMLRDNRLPILGAVKGYTHVHSLRKTCKPGSNPCLTTSYAISGARILIRREERTRTRSTQTCCPNILTARPSPPANFDDELVGEEEENSRRGRE